MQAYDPKYLYHSYLPPLGLGYLMGYIKRECWFVETSFHHKVDTLIAEKPDMAAIGALGRRYGFRIVGVMAGRVAEDHAPVELAGFAGIPVRDEVRLELQLLTGGI